MAPRDDDPHDLQRFLHAQAPVWTAVCEELSAGDKRSHWMWFVFPQLAGLGRSDMAQRFALSGLDEARAYAAHPVLGARLRQACALVLGVQGLSAQQVFGTPDDLKLRSSMTLFQQACPREPVFAQVLQRHFHGQPDPLTLKLLGLPPGTT